MSNNGCITCLSTQNMWLGTLIIATLALTVLALTCVFRRRVMQYYEDNTEQIDAGLQAVTALFVSSLRLVAIAPTGRTHNGNPDCHSQPRHDHRRPSAITATAPTADTNATRLP
jgi:hypothetical protein